MADCFASVCRCCECQGKHCLMGHPGHSHRWWPDSLSPGALSREVFDLQRTRNEMESLMAEHFSASLGWWHRLWLQPDTTEADEADIARMEGEGGVAC